MFDKCFKGLLTFVDKPIQIGQGLKDEFRLPCCAFKDNFGYLPDSAFLFDFDMDGLAFNKRGQ